LLQYEAIIITGIILGCLLPLLIYHLHARFKVSKEILN
jgi:hypothetical protein